MWRGGYECVHDLARYTLMAYDASMRFSPARLVFVAAVLTIVAVARFAAVAL